MKSGISGEKKMDLVFPRLNLSGTEKIGFNADSRKEACFYERLGQSSQGFKQDRSVTILPLPSNSSSNSVPSASPNHAATQKRNCASSFRGLTSHDFDISNPRFFTNHRNSFFKKLVHADDYLITAASASENASKSSIGQQNLCREKLTSSITNSQGFNVSNKLLKQTRSTDFMPRLLSEENRRVSQTNNNCARRPSVECSTENNELILSQPKMGLSMVDESIKLDPNSTLLQQNCISVALSEGTSDVPEKPSRKRSSSTMAPKLESIPLDDCRSSCVTEIATKALDRKPLRAGDVVKNGCTSDASVVNSLLCLDRCPDDVVELMGQKQFWKARRTIAHQQRVFAMQVFELHRLITVQRTVAGYPELLSDDSFYIGRPAIKLPVVKTITPELPIEPQSSNAKPKEDPQKPKLAKKSPTRPDNPKPDFVILSPISTVTEDMLAALSFPSLHSKQWPVPLRSQSEGLVCKPCFGPFPPPVDLLPPGYICYGDTDLNPSQGNSTMAAYVVPAAYQQGFGVDLNTPLIPIKRAGSGCVQSLMGVSGAGLSNRSGDSLSESGNVGDKLLQLFPTANSVGVSSQTVQSDGCDDERITVIKAVPYYPKQASGSTARILQFIQEGGRQSD